MLDGGVESLGLPPGSWGLSRVQGRNEQRTEDSRIFWAFGQDSPAVRLGLWLCGFAMESQELDGSFLTGAHRCQPSASLGGVTRAEMGSVGPCPKGSAEHGCRCCISGLLQTAVVWGVRPRRWRRPEEGLLHNRCPEFCAGSRSGRMKAWQRQSHRYR